MANDPYTGVEQSVQVRGQEMLSAIAEAGTAGKRAFDAARQQVNMDQYTRAAAMAMQPGADAAPPGALQAAMAPVTEQSAVARQALQASQAGFDQSQALIRQGTEGLIRSQQEAVPLARERTGRMLQKMASAAEERRRAREEDRAAAAEERAFRREQMDLQRQLAVMELEGRRSGGGITPDQAADNRRADQAAAREQAKFDRGMQQQDQEERDARRQKVIDQAAGLAKTQEFKGQLAGLFSASNRAEADQFINGVRGSKQRKDALRLWATRFFNA